MKMQHLQGFVASALVAGAMLAGCSGGSSINPPNLPQLGASPTPTPSQAPSASPTPTATATTTTLHASLGSVLGTPNLFNPNVGDTASGGSGQVIDSILTCDPTMSDNYHIHIWLGIYVNGSHYALPYAIGMKNPGSPVKGFVNSATCFYHLHTHDSSGIVHVEDTDVSGTPITGTVYTLKSVFDVWGITVNSSQVGQFNGPVRVYTSGQIYRGSMNNGLVSASTYTQWVGDPNAIPLYSHEVIFLEVGPTYPAQLPNISFYTEF